MAICVHCNEDMLEVNSCIKVPIKINGVEYEPIKYGDESGDWGADEGRCHDCGVEKGGYHHPNCDVERCPVCSGQIISCGCIDEEDGL